MIRTFWRETGSDDKDLVSCEDLSFAVVKFCFSGGERARVVISQRKFISLVWGMCGVRREKDRGLKRLRRERKR